MAAPANYTNTRSVNYVPNVLPTLIDRGEGGIVKVGVKPSKRPRTLAVSLKDRGSQMTSAAAIVRGPEYYAHPPMFMLPHLRRL